MKLPSVTPHSIFSLSCVLIRSKIVKRKEKDCSQSKPKIKRTWFFSDVMQDCFRLSILKLAFVLCGPKLMRSIQKFSLVTVLQIVPSNKSRQKNEQTNIFSFVHFMSTADITSVAFPLIVNLAL